MLDLVGKDGRGTVRVGLGGKKTGGELSVLDLVEKRREGNCPCWTWCKKTGGELSGLAVVEGSTSKTTGPARKEKCFFHVSRQFTSPHLSHPGNSPPIFFATVDNSPHVFFSTTDNPPRHFPTENCLGGEMSGIRLYRDI